MLDRAAQAGAVRASTTARRDDDDDDDDDWSGDDDDDAPRGSALAKLSAARPKAPAASPAAARAASPPPPRGASAAPPGRASVRAAAARRAPAGAARARRGRADRAFADRSPRRPRPRRFPPRPRRGGANGRRRARARLGRSLAPPAAAAPPPTAASPLAAPRGDGAVEASPTAAQQRAAAGKYSRAALAMQSDEQLRAQLTGLRDDVATLRAAMPSSPCASAPRPRRPRRPRRRGRRRGGDHARVRKLRELITRTRAEKERAMRLVIKTVGPERMRELMSSTAGAGDGALLGQLVALSGPAGKASASKRFTAAASARGPGGARRDRGDAPRRHDKGGHEEGAHGHAAVLDDGPAARRRAARLAEPHRPILPQPAHELSGCARKRNSDARTIHLRFSAADFNHAFARPGTFRADRRNLKGNA